MENAPTIKVKRSDHPDGSVSINLADYNPQKDELADGEELPEGYVPPDKRTSDADQFDPNRKTFDNSDGGKSGVNVGTMSGDPNDSGSRAKSPDELNTEAAMNDDGSPDGAPMPVGNLRGSGNETPATPEIPVDGSMVGNATPPPRPPVAPAAPFAPPAPAGNAPADATGANPPVTDARTAPPPPPAPGAPVNAAAGTAGNRMVEKIGRRYFLTDGSGKKLENQPDNGFTTAEEAAQHSTVTPNNPKK